MISEERLQQLFVQEQERFAVEKLLGQERAAIRFARAVEREARLSALEEAAKACDGLSVDADKAQGWYDSNECAAAIRALAAGKSG